MLKRSNKQNIYNQHKDETTFDTQTIQKILHRRVAMIAHRRVFATEKNVVAENWQEWRQAMTKKRED